MSIKQEIRGPVPLAPTAEPERFYGLDLLRFAAVVFIVFFHCLRDFGSNVVIAHGPDTAWVDIGLSVSAIYQNETLILISVVLVLSRDYASYGELVRERVNRLVPPYAIGSVFYLISDAMFGNSTPVSYEDWGGSLAFIFLAGGAKYHLHFFPTLLLITMLIPWLRILVPLWGIFLIIVLTAVLRVVLEMVIVGENQLDLLQQLLALNAIKIVSYVPFAFFANFVVHSVLNVPRNNRALLLLAGIFFLLIAVLVMFFHKDAAATPQTVSETVFLTVVQSSLTVLGILLLVAQPTRYLAKRAVRSKPVRSVCDLALGIFLVHPFVIDLVRRFYPTSPVFDQALFVGFFIIVALLSYSLVLALSRFGNISKYLR